MSGGYQPDEPALPHPPSDPARQDDPGHGYWIDETGEHRWFKLERGRLDVGIIAETGDPVEHAVRFIDALGDDPGEVHIDVAVARPSWQGYSQPGCAGGTWLTDTILGRLSDGLDVPPTIFAIDPGTREAFLEQVTVNYQRRLDS